MLATQDAGAFAAAYNEVLGDAYSDLGRIAEAQDAYQKILMDPSLQGSVDQQLVQWKSLDLPALASQAAEPEVPSTVESSETEAGPEEVE